MTNDVTIEKDSITLPTTHMTLERDTTTKIPVTLFDFELPYIDLIYGGEDDGRVVVLEQGEATIEEPDTLAIYQGLRMKYRQFEATIPEIATVYRDAKDFAKKAGLPAPGDAAARSRAAIVDHSGDKAKPKAKGK